MRILILITFLSLFGCNSNQPAEEQYLILISLDGFRYDYAEKHQAKNLLDFASKGVKAESMIPSYPSKTFPNHYTIVTGLYPDHHGLVANGFYDPNRDVIYNTRNRDLVEDGSWYGGTPIWNLAENNGVRTASFYWVGTEADVQGMHPTFYKIYDRSISNQERVDQVVRWLQLPYEERPRFITLYFELIDDVGHQFGPDAPETGKAVKEADQLINNLVMQVDKTGLPVNYVVVSDHGMTELDTEDPILISELVDLSELTIVPSDALLMLHHRDQAVIDKTYDSLIQHADHFKVYKKKDIPEYLHYGSNDRVGDLLLIPEPPYVFSRRGWNISPGAHGFDPYTVKDMHGIFYAWGPAINENTTIPSFENIHVFPFMAEILDLPYQDLAIDGDPSVLKKGLK